MKGVIFALQFGESIPWMSVFVKSCQHNPDIDWVIFTDVDYKLTLPGNVSIHHMTLDMFIELANQTFQTKITNLNPYKVCDFRPSFGTLFKHHTTGYSFWGHCDLDVIFGNIQTHILKHAQNYDIVSTRGGFYKPGRRSIPKLCGGLSVYKNTDIVNNLYNRCNFKSIITDNKHHAFDEHGISKIARQCDEVNVKWDEYIFNYPHDVTIKRWWYSPEYHPGTVHEDHIWLWEDGKLYFRNREIGYLHFQDWKRDLKFNRNITMTDDVKKIYISKFGFSLR